MIGAAFCWAAIVGSAFCVSFGVVLLARWVRLSRARRLDASYRAEVLLAESRRLGKRRVAEREWRASARGGVL